MPKPAKRGKGHDNYGCDWAVWKFQMLPSIEEVERFRQIAKGFVANNYPDPRNRCPAWARIAIDEAADNRLRELETIDAGIAKFLAYTN